MYVYLAVTVSIFDKLEMNSISEYLHCRFLESQASCAMGTPALVCIQYELQVHEGEVVAGSLVVSTMGARRRGCDRY